MRGLEAMEKELLMQIKEMNGVLDKEPRSATGNQYVEVGGLRYHTAFGCTGGNTGEVLILVSTGNKYPTELVVKRRIKLPSLAENATETFGSLPAIVPGLHKEVAADLMATASAEMRSLDGRVVQMLLDVPSMQRSKQYYLKKIEEFFQKCSEPVGKYCDTKAAYTSAIVPKR